MLHNNNRIGLRIISNPKSSSIRNSSLANFGALTFDANWLSMAAIPFLFIYQLRQLYILHTVTSFEKLRGAGGARNVTTVGWYNLVPYVLSLVLHQIKIVDHSSFYYFKVMRRFINGRVVIQFPHTRACVNASRRQTIKTSSAESLPMMSQT